MTQINVLMETLYCIMTRPFIDFRLLIKSSLHRLIKDILLGSCELKKTELNYIRLTYIRQVHFECVSACFFFVPLVQYMSVYSMRPRVSHAQIPNMIHYDKCILFKF